MDGCGRGGGGRCWRSGQRRWPGSPGAPRPAAAPEPPPPAAPPPPPAACLLDPGRLAAVTGLAWAPDQSTASDTRCVYDAGGPVPAGPTPSASASAAPSAGATGSPEFLTVEVAPSAADGTRTELATVSAACAAGSRAPVRADGSGFVCRFRGGSVLAATVQADRLVTVSASAVPAGTTAERLVLALQQQLGALGN